MRGRLPKNNTHLAFLLDLFQSKKRVDGREWTDFRSFDVSYDPTCRLTHIRLGKTRLMCTLDAEISAPRKSTKPGAGSIAFSVDFLPMAHPSAVETNSFDNEIEQCLVILESLFRDTYCLDFDTLCIESNKYVFDIKCEIKILDYDGGLWDASVLAVSCAITHFKRSDVSYNSITKKLIVHSNDKPPIPLTVYYKPVTTTFGFINGIDDPIIDPTMEESLLVDGFLIIGANHRDEICLISQSGNLNVNQKSIEKCCEIALKNVKELIGYINTIKIK
ncbi:unnamed protein product [Meloidogyne enterolobii]|uniref:Uncharacterized protein n=1 Tax=Meloidogyne enterolobii TaxID=390850 RepID=A0ACB1AL03_MELEN